VEATFTIGNIITIVVVVLTGLFNYLKSTTRIEMQIRQLKEQVEKQNGSVAELQRYNIHHLEDCHKSK